MSEKVMFLQKLPGGLCFAHGPYTTDQCPQWPKCTTDPHKVEYLHQALEELQRQQKKNMQPAKMTTLYDARKEATMKCLHCVSLLEKLNRIEGLVKRQVFDEGLWFKAQTAPEGYLQQELRRLHNLVRER